jgi:hypothetical protein
MTDKLTSKDRLHGVLFILAIAALPAAVWGVVQAYDQVAWDEVWALLSRSPGVRLTVLVSCVLFARGLFWVRERFPRFYGSVEILVGATIVSLAVVASTHASNFERGLKIATGLYLMVRGHDNRINGYRKHLAEEGRKASIAAAV